jgi:hypothetical protein
VDGSLAGMPMVTLRPGVSLRGGTLRFGAKGVRLTSGNRLEDVNVYDGSLDSARFQSITTHADGAIGIQVSKDLPVLDIVGSVTTFGGQGTSLVRGRQVRLSAITISIQPGGRIGRLSVGGSLSGHGDDIVTLEVEGILDMVQVRQGITATGVGSDAVRLAGKAGGLDEVTVTAAHGHPIVRLAPAND